MPPPINVIEERAVAPGAWAAMTAQGPDQEIKFLDANPPRLAVDDAAEIADTLFGIEGDVSPLYSERDQNFRVRPANGEGVVLKVSNTDEDPDVVDFHSQVLLHIERRDPGLPVPRVIRTRTGEASTIVEGPDGKPHIVRMLSYLPGVIVKDVDPTPALLRNLGATLARLDLALRGFFHPAANHELPWDLRQAPKLRRHSVDIADPGRRARVERVLDHFTAEVLPRLEGLRGQIIHNDANFFNVLVDPDKPEVITGIIDFGDTAHGPLIVDLAMAGADATVDTDDPVGALCELASGYDIALPLDSAEIDLLHDLVLVRHATTIVIVAWRAVHKPDYSDYLDDHVESLWAGFDRLLAVGRGPARDRLRGACGFPPYCPPGNALAPAQPAPEGADEALDELLDRRRRRLGPALGLFYGRPLHLVRGEGVWLYDESGRAYLDAYNNVAHVGHAHPHVVRAIARQAAALNTNTRYLYRNILDYADRLAASMPGELGVCVFVNSGSEANDVALQMARAHTGHDGALVMENAYHGVTEAMNALSPYDMPEGGLAPHVRTLMAPDTYRGPFREGEGNLAARYAECADDAIDSLAEAGYKPAAFMVDTSFCSNGIIDVPEGYLAAVVDKVRAANGVVIADEVQVGFGRSGSHMWGFETHGVVPDIVTLGKPIGNGYPIGVVVTTPEILRSFTRRSDFFSTFGGNPVACAAGLAVPDVLEREQLLANARDVGAYLRDGFRAIGRRHELIGGVRGRGLLVGVELVRDRATQEPAADETVRVMNHMRDNGVLVGREGPFGNVLKIRPPMVFRRKHADILIEALAGAVAAT